MGRERNGVGLTRREVIKAGLGAAAFAMAAPRVSRAQTFSRRPNILLLMDDQHRGDCVGVDGNAVIRTPNLDRLAKEGAWFHRAYSTTPTCTPARTALLTGLGPWRHGMLGMSKMAEKYPLELPQAMRDAGYYTTGIGKMHYHPQRNGHGLHKLLLDESSREETPEFRSDYRAWFATQAPNLDFNATGIGWNDYRAKAYALPEELHPTRWTGDTAVRFLETYRRPEPFFLKVSFTRPHSPYDPPERLMNMYADADLPRAKVGAWAGRNATPGGSSESYWQGDLGADQVRHSRQGYYGSVTFVDEQIGRIVETLERRGWLEETFILFLSDHGDMTGDHHLWRKSYPYESSVRIPMLVRWPEGLVSGKRGQTLHQPVEIRDVLPTLLEVAGKGRDGAGLEGRSLIPLAEGKSKDWRRLIDLEHDICYHPGNHWTALTDGRWKYIFHARDGEEQLFDMKSDPGEERDLAGDTGHARTLRVWRSKMVEHLAERGEAWVKAGRLALRPEAMPLSPNFPGCSCHPLDSKGRPSNREKKTGGA
ncbi:MAG: arylsulfatase [Candidatus Hydrogenedentes bacterium]|nr:arylsulfatase [Candidatus Hydrogenedentota bacterium]